MNKISGVIITRNEEQYIEKCLQSLQGVTDEIVVVDSYSTDKTKEICLQYGARFIEHPFEGFTTQKNFANEQATFDFILSLDADEALSDELKKEIIKAKASLSKDGYAFNRLNNYCGKWIRYSNWYPDRKIRLFDRRKAKWSGANNLHEVIVLDHPENEGVLKGNLLHWAYDSYSEHYLKIDLYTTIAAKNFVLRRKNKTYNVVTIAIKSFWKFFKNYFIKKGFLDGFQGFVICSFAAIGTFLKYIKINEYQKNNTKS